MADLLAVESFQDVGWRLAANLHRGRILVPDFQVVRQLSFADHDSQWLVRRRERHVVFVAKCEARIVGEDGASADHDGVCFSSQRLNVAAGLCARDPLAGAIGRGDAAIDGRGILPGHERTPTHDAVRPDGVHCLGLCREDSTLDIDACGQKRCGAASGIGVRIGLCVDDPGNARGDQRLGAGAGAAGVVARFEGDDGGGAPCAVPRAV